MVGQHKYSQNMAAPLLTWRRVGQAALFSGATLATGDALSQFIRHQVADEKGSEFKLNLAETARFGLVGLTWQGPVFYYGYTQIEKRFAGASVKKAMLKTLLGHFTLFPVGILAFYTYIGLLEGLTPAECFHKVTSTAPSTFVTGSAFWLPVNAFNFLAIPPASRVIFGNIAGVFWNAFLS